MDGWQALGLWFAVGIVGETYRRAYVRWRDKRRASVGLIAEIERGQAVMAAANRLALDVQVEASAELDNFAAEFQRLNAELAAAVAGNTPAEAPPVAQETSVPDNAVYMTLSYPVTPGAIVRDVFDRPIGIALESARTGDTVLVQTSGYAQVAMEPPALPEIPLDTIRDIRVQSETPSIDVTTWGDLAEGRGSQFVVGRRRVTVEASCVYTEALDFAQAGRDVMLHGQRMTVMESSVHAAVGELFTIELRMQSVGEISSAWVTSIGSARQARRASDALVDMAQAGVQATVAMESLNEFLRLAPTSGRLRGSMPVGRKPKAPEPEPTVRPTGGRRFDLGDE